MLKSYLVTAFRNLRKHKLYSAINIVGLAVGMAACIVISLFVFYERSFDTMHSKNIYRLNEVQKFPGMVSSQKVALSMFPMGQALKNDYPEILNFTRIKWNMKYQLTVGEKRIYTPQLFAVDTSFLSIFDFPLIKGNRQTVLLNPHSVVLTESTAKELFGSEDPMGKTINHYGGDTMSFKVTGIIKDPPPNSQLQFNALASFSTFFQPWMPDNWGGNWLNTYLVLAPHTNTAALEKKFPAYLKKHLNGDGYKYYELFLLPFKDVHANSADIGLDYINFQKFDKNYTNIFLIIALIVLAIACINFMNLATARSAERAKEVGIRKSIGARRFQLGFQFLGETVLLSLIALALAIMLVFLLLPYVEKLSERNLRPLLSEHPQLIIGILVGTILVGIISGLYPAFYLSSFQPSKVLKGSVHSGNKKSSFRNILVIGQFVSAIFLIISTLFIFRQFNYMQQQDPGFIRDQVMTIPLDGVTYPKYRLLKERLLANALVSGVTASQDQLGSHLDQTGVRFVGDNAAERQVVCTELTVDPDYLKLYKMSLLYGRDFSSEKQANGKEYIVNEGLAQELLKDKPKTPFSTLIGKPFGFDSAGTIIGIAKDFNFNSLHYKIENLFIFSQMDWGFNTVSVKINGNKTAEAIEAIQHVWKTLYPDHPFEYQFLDDHFKEVYKADAQITQMVGILAFLAILISCLGLFGLASYSAERRIKEIGVRKVLGASMTSIVSLLSTHFLKLVLIANAIAWPLAWFTVNQWMQDYAYRLPMTWWVFLLAGTIAMVIALVTVSLLAMKAAAANPVTSLRSE